ncbi:MAG: MoaD/ThiS family protein [Actinobacteria bacterium]|nr:MoaD/ThiS family protein [Actinomycetota bacterium]
MSLALKIFYPELSRVVGGSDEVWVNGTTVGECLSDLISRYPEAERLLFDRGGRLLKLVYVYVNAEGMTKAEMSWPVREKDRLIVAVLATGG